MSRPITGHSSTETPASPPSTETPASPLAHYLEELYASFDYRKHRLNDPSHLLDNYRNRDPRDLEIVGLIAASFSYGQVATIIKNVEAILEWMGPRPFRFITSFRPRKGDTFLTEFRHRWNDGRDLAYLLLSLKDVYRDHGDLYHIVAAGHRPGSPDLCPGLDNLTSTLLQYDSFKTHGNEDSDRPRSLKFLLAGPEEGSTCKRLFMYARWMVRRATARDGIDFGVWFRLKPADLIFPLDTHTSRIVQYVGLSGERRTVGLKMAADGSPSTFRTSASHRPGRPVMTLTPAGTSSL